jgi:transposase
MRTLVKDNNHLFEGQVFYLGIDVHKKNIKVTIRNNGRVLKKFSMNPDAHELYKHLQHNYPGGIYKSVYEAGFSGFWFHRELKKYGIHNIIINPADVPTTQKEKTRKTDKVDSAKLSRELENQSLEPIYIPNEEEEALRNISRIRIQIVKENTRTKNRIKSFLALYNIILPDNSVEKHWSRKFINRLKNLEIPEINNKLVLECLIQELEHQRNRKKEILRTVRKLSSGNTTIKNLMTIPGIGITIAFSLYAELYNIERFNSTDKICGIIGLVPSVSESSETKHNLGLTGRANNILRSLIIEAAWMAIGKDPALTSSFNEYCKRMQKNKAIIRIARKLVSRIRFVWTNNQEYVYGVVQ